MIKKYQCRGKTFYLVQVSFTDSSGKRHQPKIRFTSAGERISSRRQAQELEVLMTHKLKSKINQGISQHTFKHYWDKFLAEKKLEYKPSTLLQYQGGLDKWMNDEMFAN